MDKDDIQPISEIAGNIEITFNTKNKELDQYEPVLDQLVMTLGKTGRANRLTFDNLDSDSLYQTAQVIEKVAEQIEKIEIAEKEAQEEDFSVEDIGVLGQEEIFDTIKELENESNDGYAEVNKVIEEADVKSDAESLIETLKRNGDLFEPKEGCIQRLDA